MLIQQIYVKKNCKSIKGKQAKLLYEKLIKRDGENNNKIEELIEYYQQEAKGIMSQMNSLRENLFDRFLQK